MNNADSLCPKELSLRLQEGGVIRLPLTRNLGV